jgi:hypothetical protein
VQAQVDNRVLAHQLGHIGGNSSARFDHRIHNPAKILVSNDNKIKECDLGGAIGLKSRNGMPCAKSLLQSPEKKFFSS